MESFLHDKHRPILEALIMPVVVGAACAYRPLNPWLLQGSARVIIGNDFIERRMGANWFRYKKRIWRDRIKSISEGERRLRVMDRGKFGSAMLGYIFRSGHDYRVSGAQVDSERMGTGTAQR